MPFKHYGIQIVPSLSGTPTAQVRVKYNHHMADDIESMVKELGLGIAICHNGWSKKDVARTQVMLEFAGTDENWLKYDSLKAQISILQRELEIENLRKRNEAILEKIYGPKNVKFKDLTTLKKLFGHEDTID